MSNFQFRLAAVLKVRDAERQQRRLELAQAYEADRLLQQQIDSLDDEQVTVKRQSRDVAGPGQIDVDKLLELQRYALQLIGQSKAALMRQTTIREEIERRRRALVEADRQVRTLENLRDKQLAVHQADQFRVEQKMSDEIAQRRVKHI